LSVVAQTSTVSAWNDEIRAIKEMLSIAQERRNELISCTSLPVELFGRMFELLSIPLQDLESAERNHDWLGISHVCKE
jgi:hypothetical protein